MDLYQEPNIPKNGLELLTQRYLQKDDDGKIVENPKELFFRVANVIASPDAKFGDFNPEESEKKFYDMMAECYFMPNSPTLRGAGLGINLSACYVLPIEDSRRSIFGTLSDAAEIQAFGGGTGFNFSNLRPKGARINSTKGRASGPISFLECYDFIIRKHIAQGGTRQGANMGIVNYNHPDIEQFITAKKTEGQIRNFNLSSFGKI